MQALELDLRVGEQIRLAREEKGWSQAALGSAIFVSQNVISDLELGLRPIRVWELLAIANALGRDIQEFL